MPQWLSNWRRPDHTSSVGAATCYPNRSGAFGPAVVNEVEALRRSGARWYDLPADNRHSGWGR
ncbi:hypothetical protein [Micromonospora rubida]